MPRVAVLRAAGLGVAALCAMTFLTAAGLLTAVLAGDALAAEVLGAALLRAGAAESAVEVDLARSVLL